MKLKKIALFLVFIGLFIGSVKAQTGSQWRNGKQANTTYENNWSFGAGFNVVDDSGKTICGISEPGKYWNFSRPFYLSAEYYLNNSFSFMSMLSVNKYAEGNTIDNGVLFGKEPSYFAADLAAKYSLRDTFQSYVFDPYVFLGFGLTSVGAYTTDRANNNGESEIRDIPASGRMTINFGLGFNIWFSQNWGANLNLAGKLGMDSGENRTNQKQYALGVVYFLN